MNSYLEKQERRNFLSVLVGTLLAPFIPVGLTKIHSQTTSNIIELSFNIIELSFYGLFTEDALVQLQHRNIPFYPCDARIGAWVYVDEKGYCTLDKNNRYIGWVLGIDKNGIEVTIDKTKFPTHILDIKSGRATPPIRTFPSKSEIRIDKHSEIDVGYCYNIVTEAPA